jgi:hypothetical protein
MIALAFFCSTPIYQLIAGASFHLNLLFRKDPMKECDERLFKEINDDSQETRASDQENIP